MSWTEESSIIMFDHNCLYTLFRISGELLDCLKVEEAGFNSVPFSGIDDKMKVFCIL